MDLFFDPHGMPRHSYGYKTASMDFEYDKSMDFLANSGFSFPSFNSYLAVLFFDPTSQPKSLAALSQALPLRHSEPAPTSTDSFRTWLQQLGASMSGYESAKLYQCRRPWRLWICTKCKYHGVTEAWVKYIGCHIMQGSAIFCFVGLTAFRK